MRLTMYIDAKVFSYAADDGRFLTRLFRLNEYLQNKNFGLLLFMRERVKRVAGLVKETVAEIVLKEFNDPRLGFVTITGVEMTQDLKKATIFFSVMGGAKKMEEAKKILNDAKGYIRHQLSQKVILKYLPEINFEIDEMVLAARKIDKIINELHNK